MIMECHSRTRKLLELRAKTDRDLMALIGSLLERGLFDEAERLLPTLSSTQRRLVEVKIRLARELSPRKAFYAA